MDIWLGAIVCVVLVLTILRIVIDPEGGTPWQQWPLLPRWWKICWVATPCVATGIFVLTLLVRSSAIDFALVAVDAFLFVLMGMALAAGSYVAKQAKEQTAGQDPRTDKARI